MQTTLHLKRSDEYEGLALWHAAPGSDVDIVYPRDRGKGDCPWWKAISDCNRTQEHMEPIKPYLIDRVKVHDFLYPFCLTPRFACVMRMSSRSMYAGRSVVRTVVCPLLVVAALGVLVAADFLVLPLALLHKFRENSIVVLSDSLRGHLHGAVTAGGLDVRGDLLDRCLQRLDTQGLVKTLAGQDVEGGSHELDLDLVLLGVVGLGSTQGSLNGVDSIVAEAGDLDIGTDLGGVGGQLLTDVQLKLLLDGLAVELGVIPDIGVAE